MDISDILKSIENKLDIIINILVKSSKEEPKPESLLLEKNSINIKKE